MKKIHLLLLIICISVYTSCINDLDVMPLDKAVVTGEIAYDDPDSYTKALMKLYSVWAISGQGNADASDLAGLDAHNSQLLRAWFALQVISTDECKNAWPDAWTNSINGLMWTDAQCEPIEAAYQRCMFLIALTNDYLKQIGNAPSSINKEAYAAEARFCRAYAYYVLMDAYGFPPFITEENYSLSPSQLPREELFGWIENELTTILPDLPAPGTALGRADKAVANFLLARMYLNAKTYTGVERYTDCITACNAVIAGGYSLAANYRDLFRADNGQNSDVRKEIIYSICFDGTETSTSGGMRYLICGSRSSGEVALESDGVADGWGGNRATANLVNLFEYADNNDKSADNIRDSRGIFNSNGRSIEIATSCINTFTSEGWAVYKYNNLRSDGNPGSNATFPDTDFPMFRLADAYLMYAEAVARGGQGGTIDQAVEYINLLRERAFGNSTYNINSSWLAAREFRNILDERARELYWEGTRRTDLIRYGLYTSASYVWPAKGGVLAGAGTDSRYNLFPIPNSDLGVNASLKQNEGY